MHTREFVHVLWLLLWPLAQLAQLPTPGLSSFKTLTVADGLPQSYISGLVQDKQGFMWIATRDGLARFDGEQYKPFTHMPGDTSSLAANIITNLFYDRTSRLWIVYETGDIDILHTETERLQHFTKQPGCQTIKGKVKGLFSVAQSITDDAQGNIWLLGKDSGLFKYQPAQHQLQYFSEVQLGLRKNKITSITSRDGNILLVTNTGLVTLNLHGQVIERIPYRFSKPWNNTHVLLRRNGDIVISCQTRLLLYTPASHVFSEWPLPKWPMYNGPCMTFDDKENIYCDAGSGIYLLTVDNHFTLLQPNHDSSRHCISILFDRSGILWLGSNGYGIDLHDSRLPHIGGHTCTHDFFANVLEQYTSVPGSDLQATYLTLRYQYRIRQATASDSAIWFAEAGPDTAFIPVLYYLKNKRLQAARFTYTYASGGKYAGLRALAFAKDGALWGIDGHSQFVCFNIAHKTVTVYPSIKAVKDANYMLVDSKDVCWITSVNNGLFRYDIITHRLQQFIQADVPGRLPAGQLQQMQNDPFDSNILWISSLGSGLIRFNKTTGNCRCFTTNDGLPNNTVYTILHDSNGLLWCSSNKGIFSFNTGTNAIRSYTSRDGLLNDEFNRFHFLPLPDGRLAFGGTNSYIVFDPLAIVEDDFDPPVVLTGLTINNKPADYGEPGSPFAQSLNSLTTISLSWKKNFLTFHFAALEYNNPQKLQYRYRLWGINNEWVYAKTDNSATYTDIPPGRYELIINATNTSGVWSQYSKKITLIITPPIWKTSWFLLLSGLVLCILIFFIVYSRIQAVRKKEKQELQFDREVMELEAQALRAQMNPHFIFNCLNSIKLLIQTDQKQPAITYLTTFSKLIRRQLSNTHKEISLAEELETCRLYVQMEALRFGSGINYAFNISDGADIYSLMVPPLVIQPFIENAIWHGLLPRASGGKVTIEITDNDNTVLCVIDDNGIGREQAQQNKPVSIPGEHASKGIQLTHERLRLYNQMHQRGGNITVIDKKDKNGKAIGTQVSITFKKEI
jgi:ligand-binding sensor domain-containing protein